MTDPESSDPNDPETDTWWIWIPVFITFFFIFMMLIFARDNWYETKSPAPAPQSASQRA